MRPPNRGRERHVVRLMREGRQEEAVAYMKQHGLIEAFRGAPEWKRPGSDAMNLATDKPAATPEKPRMVDVSNDPDVKAVVGPGIQVLVEEYKYPDFKPVREPLPEGVKYARIHRELAHELQKMAILEDDNQTQVLLWVGLREQKDATNRKGRLIGQVFPIERNPDVLQGGWRIWHR